MREEAGVSGARPCEAWDLINGVGIYPKSNENFLRSLSNEIK